MKIFPLGACVGRSAANVNLGPPHISETTRARKLKFCTHLDGAKYPYMKIFSQGGVWGQRP